MTAMCTWCDHVTGQGVSCKQSTVEFPGGQIEASIRHASDSGSDCRDCLAPAGGYHHPGCDAERCPNCDGQLISCGCLDEDDEDEDTP
jgi:hypothetical protein